LSFHQYSFSTQGSYILRAFRTIPHEVCSIKLFELQLSDQAAGRNQWPLQYSNYILDIEEMLKYHRPNYLLLWWYLHKLEIHALEFEVRIGYLLPEHIGVL